MTSVRDIATSEAAAVVVTRPADDRVVVGVDGSPSSLDALRWAARQARLSGARLEAALVFEPTPSLSFSVGGYPAVNPVDPERARRQAQEALAASVTAALGPFHEDVHLVTVADSSPSAALLRMSRGATMLVVGAHKHSVLGLLLGSTSTACVRHAVTPVVVVPAQDPVPTKGTSD